jgi:hypothetical protein
MKVGEGAGYFSFHTTNLPLIFAYTSQGIGWMCQGVHVQNFRLNTTPTYSLMSGNSYRVAPSPRHGPGTWAFFGGGYPPPPSKPRTMMIPRAMSIPHAMALLIMVPPLFTNCVEFRFSEVWRIRAFSPDSNAAPTNAAHNRDCKKQRGYVTVWGGDKQMAKFTEMSPANSSVRADSRSGRGRRRRGRRRRGRGRRRRNT